jgi:DNA-binding NarL/FixJ family response regulator
MPNALRNPIVIRTRAHRRGEKGRTELPKMKILIVSSPSLAHVIRHLFRDHPGFDIVGTAAGLRSCAREAKRLSPELIVADVRPVAARACKIAASIKRSSPLSRLILVCPIRDLMDGARGCGADACLEQEKLVLRLVPTALALSRREAAQNVVVIPRRLPITKSLKTSKESYS